MNILKTVLNPWSWYRPTTQSDQSTKSDDADAEEPNTIWSDGFLHLTPKGAEEVIEKLDDLDIMLFSGKGYWFSYFVETVTWSEFSHIGIVLKSPTWLSPKLTGVYLLESGTESIPDAEDHRLKWGVQITDLKDILMGYRGRVYYRKLRCPDLWQAATPTSHAQLTTSTKARLRAIHDVIHNKPYDAWLQDLVRTELDLDIGDNHRTDRFVCSALVAYVYTELGLFPEDMQWDLDRPKDFGPHRVLEKDLLRGASFEGLVRVL